MVRCVVQAKARVELAKVDLLLVPTALQHYTVQEVLEQEELAEVATWPRNGNLGRFTNFVNLLDMCGIAVPSGLLRGAPQLAWPLPKGAAISPLASVPNPTTGWAPG